MDAWPLDNSLHWACQDILGSIHLETLLVQAQNNNPEHGHFPNLLMMMAPRCLVGGGGGGGVSINQLHGARKLTALVMMMAPMRPARVSWVSWAWLWYIQTTEEPSLGPGALLSSMYQV